eukprot:g5280.t1
MFNNQAVGERGVSRPIVVGLVLLLLFLSTTQDWGAPKRTPGRTQLRSEGDTSDVTMNTKEEIIRELVKSNEGLERENSKLRLEIASLKSNLRQRRSMNVNSTLPESIDSVENIESTVPTDQTMPNISIPQGSQKRNRRL